MRFFLALILFFCAPLVFGQQGNWTSDEMAYIKNHPIVTFGYDPNWPPYERYEKGRYTGICNDFISLLSKRTGLKFKPGKDLTWEKSFDLLKKGEIDMCPGTSITEERKQWIVFTDNYVHLPWVVVTKKNAYKKIDTLTVFNHQNVSIPRDYLQHEILKRDFPNINLILRDDFNQCLKDVSQGISVATVGSLGSIAYCMNEVGAADLEIANYSHYQDYGVAFAFPKKDTILRNIIQKGLDQISEAEKNKIFAKWTTINIKKTYDYTSFWKFAIAFGIIFTLLLVGFTIWNRTLRKEILRRKIIEKELSNTLKEVNKQNLNKTVLLQEIHHRVKNNLQIIISLLRLQASTQENEHVKSALSEAIERINSISMVHEHIYKNPDLVDIDLQKYIENLAEELKRVSVKDKEISIHIHTHNLSLSIGTIVPLALILNELFTNSYKYAFLNQDAGIIELQISEVDGTLQVHYYDNGVWFVNDYTKNFGTYLIDIFTDQLGGSYERKIENGSHYLFQFSEYKFFN